MGSRASSRCGGGRSSRRTGGELATTKPRARFGVYGPGGRPETSSGAPRHTGRIRALRLIHVSSTARLAVDAPVVRSIVTGTPPVRKSQEEALQFMQRVEGLPDRIADRLPALYAHTGIAYRHTGLEDYDREASEFEFFPPNWSLEPVPGTRARNEKYREIVRPLAVRLARGALEKSGFPADSITHVITVTCTGFYAPGLDVELVEALDLPPTGWPNTCPPSPIHCSRRRAWSGPRPRARRGWSRPPRIGVSSRAHPPTRRDGRADRSTPSRDPKDEGDPRDRLRGPGRGRVARTDVRRATG